jgi:hypothetical protein
MFCLFVCRSQTQVKLPEPSFISSPKKKANSTPVPLPSYTRTRNLPSKLTAPPIYLFRRACLYHTHNQHNATTATPPHPPHH